MAEESTEETSEEESTEEESTEEPAEEESTEESTEEPTTEESEEEPTEEKNNPVSGKIKIPNIRVIFGSILRILLVLLIIGGLGVFSYIGYVQISSGNADVYSDKAFYNIGEITDDSGIFSQLKTQWYKLTNPESLNTHKSVVERNENNAELGVDIGAFEANKNSDYFEGETIRGTAVVTAGGLSGEESLIDVDCELENYYGEKLITPEEIRYPGNGHAIQKSVSCNFLNGDKLSLPKLKNSLELKFTAAFEGYAIANYDVYLMEAKEFERVVYGLGEDPFNYYGISDSHLRFGNVMVSTTTPGPVNLAIGSSTSQPFAGGPNPYSVSGMARSDAEGNVIFDDSIIEGEFAPEKYYLQISLTSQENGKIKKVESLTLKVPSEIVLDEDRRNCDFKFSGEYDGNYKVYTLTDHAFYNVVNKDCSEESLNGTGITEHNCLKDFDTTGVILQCFFEVPEYSSEWSPIVATNFIAETKFIYEKEKKEYIVVRRSEDSINNDPCADLVEEECKDSKGCSPHDINEFDYCVSCSENFCSDYSENACKVDYCQLDCGWNNDACENV
jgi:hypothetical protein